MTTLDKFLNLELVDNGSAKSLIADNGRIYTTGYTSREMLRDAGFAAQREGYTVIVIGSQTWDVARLIAD